MRGCHRLSSVLREGGLFLHAKVGRLFHVGFDAQCWIITGILAIVVLLASAIDGSLFLQGRNVGLLEHPGIWAFFSLQIALPIVVKHSMVSLSNSRWNLRSVGALGRSSGIYVIDPLLRFLRLDTGGGRLTATALYGFGLIAFVWNTYQNQNPKALLSYDFWDSKHYFFGFWVTRFYKLYLFAWLLPYLGMIQVGMLLTTLRIVRQARLRGNLKLLPFHADRAGGLGFVPDLVTRPLAVTTLISLFPMTAAFWVHRAPDATPLMGLCAVICTIFFAYLVPILKLRTDIVEAKRNLIEKLRRQQQESFSMITEISRVNTMDIKDATETIEGYEKLCGSVSAISHYPHLRRIAGLIGLALTPTAFSICGKLYQDLTPFIRNWIINS